MAEAALMNKTTVAKNSFILLVLVSIWCDYEDERWDNDIDMMMNDDLWEHIICIDLCYWQHVKAIYGYNLDIEFKIEIEGFGTGSIKRESVCTS